MIGSGLLVVGFGVALIVFARVDPGRVTRSFWSQFWSTRMGEDRAARFIKWDQRVNRIFYTGMGVFAVGAGVIAIIAGLVSPSY